MRTRFNISLSKPRPPHLGLILLILGVLFSSVRTARAAIDLGSFTATPGDGQILLAWETATEFDNAGFFIVRSQAEVGEYTRISPFIPVEGDGVTGAECEYKDQDITYGVLYYYKLEAVGNDHLSEFHGPVSAILPTPTATATSAATATATSTETATATSTSTATATSSETATATSTETATATATETATATATGTRTNTPTSTATRTATPTRTATRIPTRTPFRTPNTLTPTASETPTATASATLTPTATLPPSVTPGTMPTVEYTLAAPETSTPTVAPSPTIRTVPSITPHGPAQTLRNLASAGNLLRLGLVLFMIAIWGILATGLYLYLTSRRRS